MKKALFFLFIFTIGSVLLAQQRHEQDGFEYEVVDSRSVTITGYTGNAITLNIPAQIQGLPVTAIGKEAFYYCMSLTSITIPSSVTSIGDWAFSGCMSLISITIPSSITSISDYAFDSCISLTSVTIPSSVTSIGNQVFHYCGSLTSITIPSSVTSIGRSSFSFCDSLTNITVDSRNPAYASIDGVLFDKSIRAIIAYPAGKIARTYTIPSSVTSIGNDAFAGCRSLASITIPSSVTSIGDYAFSYCDSLTSITIPSSVTSIGSHAFARCSSLTSITIPSSVTSIVDYAFSYCSNLSNITVDNRNSAYASIDGVLFDKSIRTIIAYPAGKTARTYTIPSSVTSIGDRAFEFSNLTSLTIPSSVTSIGFRAFNGCSSLTSVTLSRRTQVERDAFEPSVQITYRD